MAFNRPPHKRKLTSSDDDLPLQFVPYSAYKELHNQVVALTSLVNQLRGAIIESGQNKLALEVAESCEQLSDMSPLADPIFQHHFSSTDSPALVDPPSKFPPVTAPIAPVATINSLDIAREAAKLLDKSTRVLPRKPTDTNVLRSSVLLNYNSTLLLTGTSFFMAITKSDQLTNLSWISSPSPVLVVI
ncbi:hypothetical protein CRE_23625 [Caenorhabditis remanei]|uniref:Uncharacterized protein n=1 Tax=Caenorhabditis remanei TaxID=31234 RepID=E3MVX8_CAERE|nr:hypothetical protein CRE_23625 [Caenorhabditis remanei]